MGVGRCFSVAVSGSYGNVIECQAHISAGMPKMLISGNIDSQVAQAKMRLRSAYSSSGFIVPRSRIHITLFYHRRDQYGYQLCEDKICGSGFDLALAAAMWLSTNNVSHNYGSADHFSPSHIIDQDFYCGALGLDGRVCDVSNIYAQILCAYESGAQRIFIPDQYHTQLCQFSVLKDIEVFPVATLSQLFHHLDNSKKIAPMQYRQRKNIDIASKMDISDIVGHNEAKFRLMIGAIGEHNLLISGPSGVGKTMLAQRYPTILPPLEDIALLREYAKNYCIDKDRAKWGVNSQNNYKIADVDVREESREIYHEDDNPQMIVSGNQLSSATLLGKYLSPELGLAAQADQKALFLDDCTTIS